MLVYPFINVIPSYISIFKRKYKFSFIRLLARKAVRMSFKKNGLSIGKLHKDNFGVPLRCSSYYWSITHKAKYVGGVASLFPIGIDIEVISSRSDMIYDKIATSYEWSLGKGDQENLFFRYWTAKEAVLKAEKIGLLGLSNCFIEHIFDEFSMLVRYGIKRWFVENYYFDNHVAAIAINDCKIIWSIEK